VIVTPHYANLAVWILWWLSWWLAAAWSDRAVKRPAMRHQIVYRLCAAVGVALLFGAIRPELRLWSTPDAFAWLFVALTTCGLLFTWWARIHLGRLWSSSVGRKADHRLIDTGPYGIVRHPIYTGIIVASAATAAMRGTAQAWVGAAVMTFGWYIKARLEERFLREQLGPATYAAYARRVPMLMPYVRRRPPSHAPLMLAFALALFAPWTHASEPQRIRVILDTDANNELDDQHAIAYLLFNSATFDAEAITVNRTSGGGTIDDHAREAERIVRLCRAEARVSVIKGASGSFEQIAPHAAESAFDGSAAVETIIARAHASDARPLVVVAIGKLTNVALALKKDPSIAAHVRVVWLGSNYPDPGEYNQENDRAAVNYTIDGEEPFEIALVRYGKPSGTDAVRVTMDEIRRNMAGAGPRISTPIVGRSGGEFSRFGDYSVDLFAHAQMNGTPPSRALFDLAAVAIVKQPAWATPTRIGAPTLVQGKWIDRPGNARTITIWHDFDRDAIVQDLFRSVGRSNQDVKTPAARN
jgi:protein-S-isoprenylcysteine O-methyltransferase Ste14